MRQHYVKTVDDEQQMQQGLRAVEKKQLPHMLCVTNMLLHGIRDPGFVRHDNTLARSLISYGASDRVDIALQTFRETADLVRDSPSNRHGFTPRPIPLP